jgi:hypothetical protein
MGIDFVLRLADGTSPVTLPDPGSGTFTAAGDFDGVLFRSSDALEVLGRADPYGDNVIFTHDEAEGMLRDIEILLDRTLSGTVRTRRGSEHRLGAGSCACGRWLRFVVTTREARSCRTGTRR